MFQLLIVTLFLYTIITSWIRSLKINRNYSDLSVVITGCDSGFGQELAYRLDKHKFNVFAACLTTEGAKKLEQTTSKTLKTAVVDIRHPETITQLLKLVKDYIIDDTKLWVLVNNAGTLGPMGTCGLLKKDEYLQVMDVNFFGMMEVTQQFLPLLRKSKGRIINTSSISGKIALPFLQPYAVSKFCVEAFSDCLRRELYHEGISISVIEPGVFATKGLKQIDKEIVRSSYLKNLDRATEEEKQYYGTDYPDKVADASEKQFFVSKDTYKVVNAYFHAITARFPKTRYVVGVDGNIFLTLQWLLPEWIIDFLLSNSPLGAIKPAFVEK